MAPGGQPDAVAEIGGEHAVELMDSVESLMLAAASGHGPLLARFAGETIASGGKRLRPLLVLVCAGVPPPPGVGLVQAAVAVELLHSATLVHDDVLDRAALRRGRATVVARGGRGAATATGDLLFSRAFAELATTGSAQSVKVLARASSELAEGELMQRADAFAGSVSLERYLARCRRKTAVLFAAACELGALHAGGPAHDLAAFGERIGIAFQILDDVLDVCGPPERTGKPRGTDLLDGTVTLPLILARKRDAALAGLALREIRTPEHAAAVCEAIEATGAPDQARAFALERVQAAKAGLPPLPPRQAAALELIADRVVERYS